MPYAPPPGSLPDVSRLAVLHAYEARRKVGMPQATAQSTNPDIPKKSAVLTPVLDMSAHTAGMPACSGSTW
jgi:hypothetical protein